MKSILVFTILILADVARTELTLEGHQKFMEISKACMAETGATDEMIVNALVGFFSDDPKFKEELLCIGKKLEIVDGDGKVIKEGIKKQTMMLLGDEAKVDIIIAKCTDEKATPQETAFENTKCFFKEMHSK